jgi:hypothetical protein
MYNIFTAPLKTRGEKPIYFSFASVEEVGTHKNKFLIFYEANKTMAALLL